MKHSALECLCGCGKLLDPKNMVIIQITETVDMRFKNLALIFRHDCFDRISERFYMLLGELKKEVIK